SSQRRAEIFLRRFLVETRPVFDDKLRLFALWWPALDGLGRLEGVGDQTVEAVGSLLNIEANGLPIVEISETLAHFGEPAKRFIPDLEGWEKTQATSYDVASRKRIRAAIVSLKSGSPPERPH
ncbi:MAG: hypothetical protein AB8G99_18870, partial [Planctomycetaceae bacterium]